MSFLNCFPSGSGLFGIKKRHSGEIPECLFFVVLGWALSKEILYKSGHGAKKSGKKGKGVV